MLSKKFFPGRTTILSLMVSVTYLYPSTQTTLAATLRLFPEIFIDDTLSLKITTPETLINSDLLSQLISEEDILIGSEESLSSNGITEAVSGKSSLSIESIVSSLTQINLDTKREDINVREVPILPQVAAPDIYKEIYDFGTTSAEDLSDPVSIGVLPLLDLEPLSVPTPTFRGGVRTTNNGLPSFELPGFDQPSLPSFGGPVGLIGAPQRQLSQPLSQVPLPSAKAIEGGSWGDSQVDVFFASLPKAEVVDVDTFMRTIYRTSPSDMIKQIDESLDLTIDTEFNSMPADIFPANAMPSGEFRQNL